MIKGIKNAELLVLNAGTGNNTCFPIPFWNKDNTKLTIKTRDINKAVDLVRQAKLSLPDEDIRKNDFLPEAEIQNRNLNLLG